MLIYVSPKYYIAESNYNQAKACYDVLISINFQGRKDEIIENQKNFLLPRVNVAYSEVQKASELSKNGNHQEALTIFQNLISQNILSELHHENYGWTIYRYIRAEYNNLSSREVKIHLMNYLNLNNERPSMLHSMILNFALKYSRTQSDFKLYNFFLLWNPNNLRDEDLHDNSKDGEKISSLISRICREFVNSNSEIDIGELLDKINLSSEVILDFFREPIFWRIFNAHKENKFFELWSLFDNYNLTYSGYEQSKWHSEILNLAERFMKANEEWRFLNFFKNWSPEYLRKEDWDEVINGDNKYKPLAIKSIKKSFTVLKNQDTEQDLSWLIQTYETAIKLFPDDEWLLREKALLHLRNNELETAIKIYKQLILRLSDKHYIWQELSNCIISDNSLKIGILSKALSLEKNEDFLGDIHLCLAEVLINENFLSNALVELETYKKHREEKNWKLSPLFSTLYEKTSLIKHSLKDNQELYRMYIPFAENFVYADFDWIELMLIDKWQDNKGKDRLTFTDGETIELVIGKNRFEVLRQAELGQVLNFKLHKQEVKKEAENKISWHGKNIMTEYKYIPLLAEKSEKEYWSMLKDTFAVIDYINKEKNIIHAITTENKEIFFPQTKPELQHGDFITAKSYIKKVKDKNRTELRQIQKINKNSVISKFLTQIAVIDEINDEKQLFHFVISSELQGIIKFTETNLRPREGDFIKIAFATKTDKSNKIRVKALSVEPTEEVNINLRKDLTGFLEVKYKDRDCDNNLPDFAFIEDYYVPKYLLEKHNITYDCKANVRVVCTGNKWRVIKIEKV